MTTELTLKEQILELNSDGKSYRDIQKILGCSRSTISYHLKLSTRENTRHRQVLRRKEFPLSKKIEQFRAPNSRLNSFLTEYGSSNSRPLRSERTFTMQEVFEKSGNTCYLTGDTIDFSSPKTYHLDHRVPRSKGGQNTLENCEVATKAANMAKADLTLEEFFELCIKVVKHNKLKID